MKEVVQQIALHEIDQVLGSLAPAMTSAYATTMSMIKFQSSKKCMLAHDALSLIALARRPLKPQEMLCLLALDIDSTTLPGTTQLHSLKSI